MARRIPDEAARARFVGRMTRSPQAGRRRDGQMVCRLFLAKEAAGPMSRPATVAVYVGGELAERCALGLQEGYLIEVFGDLQPLRERAKFPEVLADVVRLFDKGAEAGAAA